MCHHILRVLVYSSRHTSGPPDPTSHRKSCKELLLSLRKAFATKSKKAIEGLRAASVADPARRAVLAELGLPENFTGEELGHFLNKLPASPPPTLHHPTTPTTYQPTVCSV